MKFWKFLLPVWKFLLVCLLQTTSRIDKEMQEPFSKGFNFHLQSKFGILNIKVQIGKLFEDIKDKERAYLVKGSV